MIVSIKAADDVNTLWQKLGTWDAQGTVPRRHSELTISSSVPSAASPSIPHVRLLAHSNGVR